MQLASVSTNPPKPHGQRGAPKCEGIETKANDDLSFKNLDQAIYGQRHKSQKKAGAHQQGSERQPGGHLFCKTIALGNAFDLRAVGDFGRGGHAIMLIGGHRGACLQIASKRHIIGGHFIFNKGCNGIVIVAQLTKGFSGQNRGHILGELHHIPFARHAGCGKGEKCGGANHGFEFHVNLQVLIAGAGEQNHQSQNDGTKAPNAHQHACANGGANGSASLRGFRLAGIFAADGAPIGNQPNQHKQIEGNEAPFEDKAEKAALGFAQTRATMRAFGGLLAYILFAFFAGNQRHKNHSPNIVVNQCNNDNSAFKPIKIGLSSLNPAPLTANSKDLTNHQIERIFVVLRETGAGIDSPIIHRRSEPRPFMRGFSMVGRIGEPQGSPVPVDRSVNPVRPAAILTGGCRISLIHRRATMREQQANCAATQRNLIIDDIVTELHALENASSEGQGFVDFISQFSASLDPNKPLQHAFIMFARAWAKHENKRQSALIRLTNKVNELKEVA